jgi:Zn-dependent protease
MPIACRQMPASYNIFFQYVGGDVDQIVLWPLGGYTLCRPTNGKVGDDLWIAVMGPVMHIPQAIAWVGVYAALTHGDFSQFSKAVNLEERRASGIDEFASIMAVQAVVMNAALFIINLAIPAYPLDGGRCLAVLMVMAGFSAKASAIITAIFAILIALSGVFYGTYLYVVEKSEIGVIIALIAMLICYSSLELWKAAACGRIHDHPLFDRECYKMNRQRSNAKPALTPSVNSNML